MSSLSSYFRNVRILDRKIGDSMEIMEGNSSGESLGKMKSQPVSKVSCMELGDKGKEAVIINQVDMASDQKVADQRSLFSTSFDQTLSQFPPQKENGKVVVWPPQEVFKDGEILWKNSMVAQFISKVLNFNLFQKLVNVLWGSGGKVVMV